LIAPMREPQELRLLCAFREEARARNEDEAMKEDVVRPYGKVRTDNLFNVIFGSRKMTVALARTCGASERTKPAPALHGLRLTPHPTGERHEH
jgi:hypothetical protein